MTDLKPSAFDGGPSLLSFADIVLDILRAWGPCKPPSWSTLPAACCAQMFAGRSNMTACACIHYILTIYNSMRVVCPCVLPLPAAEGGKTVRTLQQ